MSTSQDNEDEPLLGERDTIPGIRCIVDMLDFVVTVSAVVVRAVTAQ